VLLPAVGVIISQHLGVTNVLPYLVTLSAAMFIAYEAVTWSAARARRVEVAVNTG
jgi:hypothetical protein